MSRKICELGLNIDYHCYHGMYFSVKEVSLYSFSAVYFWCYDWP